MQSNYVSIATGEAFKGKIPEPITIPVSREDKGIIITEAITAGIGDKDYQGVLDTWMVTHGYMRIESDTTIINVVLKGGPGSGHHGHKGRKGREGGSLPREDSNSDQIKLPRQLDSGTMQVVQERQRERIRIMEEYFPGIKFSLGRSNPLAVKQHIVDVPGISYPKAIYDNKIEGISNPEIIKTIVELQKKHRTPYVSYNTIKFSTNYTFQEIFAALKFLKTENPNAVSFTVDRLGNNTAVKVNEIIKKEVSVVLKGGAGSGFHGHKGIPGHQGGSLPRNVSFAKVKEPVFVGTFSDIQREQLKKDITALCDQFGFPVNKVIIDSTNGYQFKVGSDSYRSAAHYDPKTGTITLFAGSRSYTEDEEGHRIVPFIQKSIFSHEIMHARFHTFQKLAQRQEALLEKRKEENPDIDYHDKVTDGIVDEYKEEFWALDIWDRNYHYLNKRRELFKTAVSDYGNSYIKSAEGPKAYGVDLIRAVDENLAEVAGSRFVMRQGEFDISKRWFDLYTEINESLLKHGLIKGYPDVLDIHKDF